MLATGRLLSLSVLIVFGAAFFWNRARLYGGAKRPEIRPIAGLQAIPEAIQRCAEMGRPLHYSIGSGELDSEFAPQTFSGLQVLGYVAELCAQYDVRLIATCRSPVAFPIMQDIVRQSFIAGGRPEMFNESTVRFLSNAQFAATAGVMGIMKRENIGANIMIGPFYAEGLIMAETASSVNALQIGGTVRMYILPFFVVVCDYSIIGDEMFAAGAYLSKDPSYIASIQVQDHSKIIAIGFAVLGVVLATLQIPWLSDLLKQYGK